MQQDWLRYVPLVAVAALCVAVYQALLNYHRHKVGDLRQSAEARASAFAKIPGARRWDQYRRGLGTTLDRLDKLMGRGDPSFHPRWLAGLVGHLHGRGLLIGYLIALGYTIVALLLAWVVGAEARLGDVVLLRDDPEASWAWRLLLVVALVGSAVASFQMFRHIDHLSAMIDRANGGLAGFVPTPWQRPTSRLVLRMLSAVIVFALATRVPDLPILAATAMLVAFSIFLGAGVGALALIVAFAGAVAFAVTVATTVAGAGEGALALAVASALAVGAAQARALAIAREWVIVGTAALAYALLVWRDGYPLRLGSFVFFLVLLPWLNAFFDWLSWAISRYLGRGLERLYDRQLPSPGTYGGPPPGRARFILAYGGHMVVDLVAALALLAGLAWAMPAGIEAFNVLVVWLGYLAPLPLEGYLCSATKEPWPQGAWAGAMLFSTLVPTLLHLVALLMSPFAWLMRPTGEQAMAAEALARQVELDGAAIGLAERLPEKSDLTEREAHVLATYLILRRPLAWVAGTAGAALFFVALWALATCAWQPLPQLLLWIARGETAVAACFSTL